MKTTLFSRFVSLAAVLFLVSLTSFMLIELLPGDPSTALVPPGTSAEVTKRVRQELGLDQGPAARYVHWVGRVAHGDLGRTFNNGEPVARVLVRALTVTIELMVLTQLFALVLGVVVGAVTAHRAGGRLDRVVQAATFAVLAVPQFAVALVLLLVFAVHLHWFPAVGFVHLSDDPVGNLRSLVLPTITLGLPVAAIYARMVRTEMVATLTADHIVLARGLGIPERRIVLNHALRQSLSSLLAVFAIETGRLLGGALIVETIFALPGMGRLLITSVGKREYLLVQGGVLVVGAGFVIANFAVDIARSRLDPRIRFDGPVIP